jgi:PAS domain S-box-containing protein
MSSDSKSDAPQQQPMPPEAISLLCRAAAESPQGLLIGRFPEKGCSLIVNANKAFERITGYPPAETCRAQVESLLAEDSPVSRGQWLAVAERLQRGETFDTTLRAARRDGVSFWAFVHGYPLPSEQGPVHWALVVGDVSALHEPLLQLRENEERYRLLAENSRDLITVHRFDGLCIYASPASRSMLGYEPEELLQRPLESLFHPEDCGQIRRVLDRHFHNQPEHLFTHRLLRRDGTVLWCETTSKTTFGLQGSHAGGLIAITRDISKRRAAERELQEMHLQLSSVFESVPVGLCITSPSGRILQCNQGFAATLGRPAGELTGVSIEELLPSDQLAPGARDITCRRADGEDFHAQLSVTALSLGEDANTLYTLSDQTERDAINARLREAQRLESLGTLAGGIAHDFNNLLAIILGYGSLLKVVAPDNARIAEYGDTIMDAGRRGADVVRQLMLYANQHEPLLVEEDIHTVLANVLVRTSGEWPEPVRLECSFDSALPVISIDPEQIGRAVEHLLRNAREAITGEGLVRLATADRLGQGENPQAWLEITVTDNGCGMDETTRSRIFEPFFSRGKGAEVRGLGLALVYGIVRAHRGDIEVDSAPGRGTTVRLLIPRPWAAHNAPVSEPAHHESEYKLGASRTVLVVEDEADIGRLWLTLLEKQGWEVLWGRTGAEALSLFEANAARLDIVFSDIGLPGGIDGWDVCRHIRAARPGIPIILASGYFKRGLASTEDFPDPVAYIGKPYQPGEVLRKLAEMTDGLA